MLLAALALAPGWAGPARAAPAAAWIAPAPDLAAPVGPDELAVRWLGTAAFEFRTARATVLIDPHFSRHGLMSLLGGPIAPDVDRIRRHLRPADAIFVGHAHHDHLVDGPTIAKLLGAPIYGSKDTAVVARAAGVPADRVRTLTGFERVRVGDLEIEAIPSRHSDMITNWLVAGPMPEQVELPMRFWDYKHGQVFTYVVRWRGRTVYHFGSAEIVEENFAGHRADLVLLCMSGWKDNPGIFARVARTLSPRAIAPMHHDDFFRPLEEGFHEGQLAFLKDGYPVIARAMPQSRLIRFDLPGEVRLAPEETP